MTQYDWMDYLEQGKQQARQSGQTDSSPDDWRSALRQGQQMQSEACYKASGMDALRRDLQKLQTDLSGVKGNTGLDAFRSRTDTMLGAVQNQRNYFQKYKQFFSDEQRAQIENELGVYEQFLSDSAQKLGTRAKAQTAQATIALATGTDPMSLRSAQRHQEALNKGLADAAERQKQVQQRFNEYLPTYQSETATAGLPGLMSDPQRSGFTKIQTGIAAPGAKISGRRYSRGYGAIYEDYLDAYDKLENLKSGYGKGTPQAITEAQEHFDKVCEEAMIVASYIYNSAMENREKGNFATLSTADDAGKWFNARKDKALLVSGVTEARASLTPNEWERMRYDFINDSKTQKYVLGLSKNGDENGKLWPVDEDYWRPLLQLKEEEKAAYNYLFHAYGAEDAGQFLDVLLQGSLDGSLKGLKQREAEARKEEWKAPVARALYSMGVGLDTVWQDVNATLRGEVRSPNLSEQAVGLMSEDAGKWGRGVINAAGSFGRMIPSMAVSLPVSVIAGEKAGNLAGQGVTFLTSGASAYQEGMRHRLEGGKGFSEQWQGAAYGTLSGLSEAALGTLTSHMPGMKGLLPEAIGEKIAEKFTSGAARALMKWGTGIASEELEEITQDFLEPLFVSAVSGRNYDAPTWEELSDTALSVLLLTGVSNIQEISPSNMRYEAYTVQQKFADAAMKFDQNSDIYRAGKQVQDILEQGRLVDGKTFRAILKEAGADWQTMNKVYNGEISPKEAASGQRKAEDTEIDWAGKPTAEQPDTAVREQGYSENYQNLGWTVERSNAAAAVLDKVVRGENVRNADIQKLRLNTEKGAAVLSEVLGVPVAKAANNNVAANQTFRQAEMSYRMARSYAEYGEADINWKTLPPTQESADAIMVHPEAKADLEAIRRKPFSGTYAEQTRQIMQQLSIWWAANASRFTPEAASIQVERWRSEHPQQAEAPTQAADMNAESPEESTAINDTAEGHTVKQQAVIEAYKESVDEGLVEFVQNSVNNKGQNRGRYYLNDVSPRAERDIYELTGVDASGFKTVLEQRMAEHIYKEHGPEGTTDQSMANLNDIGRIQYVLDNYDTMRQGGRSPSYTTMKPNGKPGTAQTVVYEKAVDGKYYVVEAVPDTKAKTAFVVSAYMQKRAGAPLQTVDEQTSTHTAIPENAVEAPAPKPSVAQYGTIVNPSAAESSVGAARKGFDPYSDAAIEYGTIEPGENPARVVDVPRSMDGQTRVSKLVRTAEEAAATAETAIPLIEEATTEGLFSYDPVTNEERRAKAAAWFGNYNNIESAYDAWREAAAGRKLRGMSLDTYGNGIYLYAELMANAKGAENVQMQQRYQRQAINVLSILQKSATEAGQLVQMNRMFKQLTPEGRVVSLQQSIENLNASLGKYAKQKVKLNEDLVQQWVTALNNGQEKAAALAEKNIYHDIAAQVPGTFMEKWGAWRYLCMLGNPKTIIRNLGGNVAMMPAKALKDKVGALLELTLDKSERTKYLGILSASEEGRALKTYALREFENTDLKDVITGAGKYDDSNVGGKISEAIRDAHRKLPGVLGKAQGAVDFLMNNEYFGDLGFLKHHYTVSFAEAMMARGYTVADIEQGNIPAAQLDSIRAYAINQAQKATYRDINAFSKLVRNIRFRGESTGAAFGNMVIEGDLPFKATPANVLVRAAEYGPLGIAKAIGEWAQNRAIQIAQRGVESGKLNGNVARSLAGKEMTSGAQIIEDLTSGLSGMALFGLGVLLKNLGVVSGDADDDDDRTGIQARSLNIGGVSISLDWLSPAAVPFFTGVSVADAWNDPHKSAIDAVADSVGAMFQPLLELSMLSSVQELLDTMNYGDGASAENIIYGVFVQPFFSYLAQGIPTLSAQLARTLEPNSQYTYTGDLGGSMAKRLVKSLAGIAKKIPFVNWRQYDYVDAWGRTESNGRWDERIFNNFFNPAYVSDIEVTDADEEIARLEAATGEEVSPSRRQYSITMNGEKRALTGEEYERYSKEYGEKALEMMTVLMASADYAQMDDEEKVSALKSVLSLADEYGKHAAIDDYTPRSEDKLYQLTQTGLSITEAYAAKTVSKHLTENPAINATTAASRFKNWVSRQNWTEAQEKAVTEAYGKFMTHIPAGTEKYDALAEAIGEDTALSVVDRLATLEPEDGADTVSAAQKIDAIASMNIPDKDKWAAFQEYKDDWRIEFFRKAEINPSVYAAYLEAIPQYRVTKAGKPSGQWSETTIKNWLRTTDYSYAVKLKIIDIATMKKPEEEGTK